MSLDLYDTHCHLNLEDAFTNVEAEIAFALENGVTRINVIGVDQVSSRRAIELAYAHEGIYAVAGVHPNYTAEWTDEWANEILSLAQDKKVVAIGEIGLDYHWDYSPKERQKQALTRQMEITEQLQCPVVFHCREAYPDLLDFLETRPKGQWLFHCFSGDDADLERALELGCLFGVDGPITYKNAQDLRDLVARIPLECVVIETDAPYLTPVPFRGKPNRPAYVKYVNAMLAAIWRTDEATMARTTTDNARRFFRID